MSSTFYVYYANIKVYEPDVKASGIYFIHSHKYLVKQL